MIKFLNPPHLTIFLKRSVPKLLERIKMRGRDYEQSIPTDYLIQLNRYYDEWYQAHNLGKILLVDTDELDFMNKPQDFQRLLQKIDDIFDQKSLFSYLS